METQDQLPTCPGYELVNYHGPEIVSTADVGASKRYSRILATFTRPLKPCEMNETELAEVQREYWRTIAQGNELIRAIQSEAARDFAMQEDAAMIRGEKPKMTEQD